MGKGTTTMTHTTVARLFRSGKCVITKDARLWCDDEGINPFEYLERHLRGDWGELDDATINNQEQFVTDGHGTLRSIFPQVGLQVVTEADWSTTRVIFHKDNF